MAASLTELWGSSRLEYSWLTVIDSEFGPDDIQGPTRRSIVHVADLPPLPTCEDQPEPSG